MGTVPIGTGEAAMIAFRISGISPPVDRSITVSAPYCTAYRSFASSSSMFEEVDEFPIFALILHVRSNANAHRFKRVMVDVGGNNHPPARHFIADKLRRKVFPAGYIFHFARYDAFPGIMDLSADLIVLPIGEPSRCGSCPRL